MQFRSITFAALAVAALACDSSDILSPQRQAGLAIEINLSRERISRGESAQLTYAVRNVSASPITLSSGGCPPLLYIRAGGSIVHPPGGGWVCLTAVQTWTLDPGERIARTVVVTAGSSVSGGTDNVTLPPGVYRAYAEFDGWIGTATAIGRSVELRSRDAALVVED